MLQSSRSLRPVRTIAEAFSTPYRDRRVFARACGVARAARDAVGEIDGLSRAMAATIDPILMPPGTVVGLAAEHAAGFLTGFLALRRAGQTVVLWIHWRRRTERQL